MNPSSPSPARPPPGSPAEEALLLDHLRGELEGPAAAALLGRLATEPALAARRDALDRTRAAFMHAALEPATGGGVAGSLAERLTLRVRDQVAHEEQAARRAQGRELATRSGGWSRRRWGRVLLASLGVHVVALGWIVWRDAATPPPADSSFVATAWRPDGTRDPAALREAEEPLDLGPVVASEWIPDQLLERYGLAEEDDGLSGLTDPDLRIPNMRVMDHPYEVQLPMLVRTRARVKSARLTRMGLDANGTLTAVNLGLEALTARQSEDGSFAPDVTVAPEARLPLSRLGTTALALLPFLAEGRCSMGPQGSAGDPVVASGTAWLRAQVAGARGPSSPSRATDATSDWALAVLALSEDYMLAYGRWSAADTRVRGQELRALGERLGALQREDGSFAASPRETADPASSLWPALALDALEHTGVALPTLRATERLQRWYGSLPRAPEGVPAGVDGRADALLTAGALLLDGPSLAQKTAGAEPSALTVGAQWLVRADVGGGRGPLTALAAGLALYRRDPGAFRTWSRTHGEGLLARLSPSSGVVVRGDAVADTALVLLALQASYRAY